MKEVSKGSIRSESRFIWRFILDFLLTPIVLFQVLIGKKRFSELFSPFTNLFKFIFEAKFTISIILINIAVFIMSIFFFSEQLFSSLANTPSDILSFKVYTLLTSGFLHASISHLLFNCLALFIFGRVVERKVGFSKTALVYFGALIISNLFSSLINLFVVGENTPGIGASGAIMGLVAAAMLLNPFYLTYEFIIPLPIMLVGWITLLADIAGILRPANDNIGHLAHIGGFISITLLAFLLNIDDRKSLRTGLFVNIASFLAFLIISFVFGVDILSLFL